MGTDRMGPAPELVLWLLRGFKLRTFVETGTFRGDTAQWAARHFERVITIEGAKALWEEARRRNAAPNIDFVLGDSPAELDELLPSLTGPCLFWLDAHWCGMSSYGEDRQCPLIGELTAINRSEHEHFILIDDARLFMAPPPLPHRADQWPTLVDVLGMLQHGKARRIVIMDDVIVAVPAAAALVFTDYCQKLVTTRWRQHSAEQARKAEPLAFLRKVARKWMHW